MLLDYVSSLSPSRIQPRNGYTVQRLILSWDDFVKIFLKKFYPIHKIALIRKNIMQFKQDLVNHFGGTLNVSRTTLPNVLIIAQRRGDNTKFSTTVQTTKPRPSQKPCVKRDSCKGMKIKSRIYLRIQLRKPSNENRLPKSLGIQTLSLQKEVSIFIESSIIVEARIANLARRLEGLETKEPIPLNQVSPDQLPTLNCTYCQAMNHRLEECPVFHAQQMLPDHMKAAYSRPTTIPTLKHTIPVGEII